MERFPIVLLFLHIAVFWTVSVSDVVTLECLICISNDPTTVTGQLPAGGGCCFNNTLCSYIQGYRHPAMNNWTATKNGAVTSQKSPFGQGDNVSTVYTDLQSPQLTLQNACCVEFRYISHSPSTLSMFGVLNGTEHELYNGPNIENGGGLSILITVPRDIQMLKFRAYGGGGGAGNRAVALQNVIFHLGSCSGPECNFTTSQRLPTLCGWETNSWEAGREQNFFPVARLNDSVPAGTLTTGLVKATPTTGICVQLYYTMNSVNDTISMLIQPTDDSTPNTVWESTNNNTQSVPWTKAAAAVYVFSDIAFKLVFSAKRCNNPHSVIAILSVTSTPTVTSQPSPCQQFSQPPAQNPQYEGCVLKPVTTTTTKISSASTSVTPVTTNSNPSSGSHFTSTEVITTGGGASLSTHSATNKAADTTADAQTHTGVAVGSALAGIGVIGAAVIIAIVVWKKRKQKGRGTKDKNVLKSKMMDLQPNGSSDGNNAGSASKSTYSAARNPAFSGSFHSFGDYSEMDSTEHIENPYDKVAADEVDPSTSDGYSHVDILGADKKKKQKTSVTNPYELAAALPSEDNDTDEYHHLNLQPGAKKPNINSARSAGQTDNSHIRGYSKSPPQEVQPAPHNKGKAPAAANQQEDEYNRMNVKQSLGTRRQGYAIPDGYNRLGQNNAAFDERTDATDGEYNKIGEKNPTSKQPRVATRGACDRIDVDTLPDGNPSSVEKGKTGEDSEHYNTLNFDEGQQRRQNAAENKKMSQSSKAYDHVQDDFQETYAKTQREKRERVIDSNYDHVTPDN